MNCLEVPGYELQLGEQLVVVSEAYPLETGQAHNEAAAGGHVALEAAYAESLVHALRFEALGRKKQLGQRRHLVCYAAVLGTANITNRKGGLTWRCVYAGRRRVGYFLAHLRALSPSGRDLLGHTGRQCDWSDLSRLEPTAARLRDGALPQRAALAHVSRLPPAEAQEGDACLPLFSSGR